MTHTHLAVELAAAHKRLPALGLVSWTSGNISVRVDKGSILIKPSGMPYDRLSYSNMVPVDMSGQSYNSSLKPSTDTAAHLEIYKAFSQVGSIVHTHSPYATAFAAHGRSIPCCLTAIADEFGGPIPCGQYASIGGPEIGREVVRVLTARWCPAILMAKHGVFTVGPTIDKALQAAVMVEDVARTVWLAFVMDGFMPNQLSQSEIDKAHNRYLTQYGQS